MVGAPLATKFWALTDLWMSFLTVGSTVRSKYCKRWQRGFKVTDYVGTSPMRGGGGSEQVVQKPLCQKLNLALIPC